MVDMTSRRAFLLGLGGLAAGAGLGMPALAKEVKLTTATKLVPATAKGGRVIIFRGLANVFSRGMDALAVRFIESGVQVTLDNHSVWKKVSTELIEQYKKQKNVAPIVLVGHSLGADASLVMANWLGISGVPVRLIVAYDGVAPTHPIIGTVQEIVNYYKPKGYGREVKVAKSFRGTLNNVDLTARTDIDHLNIDKDVVLQDETMAKVFQALNYKPPKMPAKPATPASSPVVTPRPKPRVTG